MDVKSSKSRGARDGQDSHLAPFKNTPVEAVIRVLIDDVTWARYGDRQRFAPFGLFGGKEGGMGQFVLNPDTPEERVAKSKGLDRLKAGDVVSLRLPGAGGYGDPKERDRELLLRDVRDGKVSRESALRDYGVEITDEMLAEKA